jgi:Tfp pilus assembly protein PilO
MNKLSKEKKDKLVLVIVVTGMAIVGIWFGLISVQKRALADTTKKTTELKDKIEKADKTLKNQAEIELGLKLHENQVKAIEETFAPGDKYSWILKLLLDFSKTYKDMSIQDSSPEQVDKLKMLAKFPYDTATFHIKATGYYHALGKFLADFENHYPFFSIQNLEMGVPPKSEEGEKLICTFDIVTLVKPTGS